MTEAGYALGSPRLAAPARPRERRRLATSALIWAFVAGNAAVMVWLWVHGGNLSEDRDDRAEDETVFKTGGFPDE